MVLHGQQPEGVEADLGFYYDELSRLGDGDLPYYQYAAHPGVCEIPQPQDIARSQEPTPSDGTPGAEQGVGEGQQGLLLQDEGGRWERMGRAWRLRPWEEAGSPYGHPRCSRDSNGRRHSGGNRTAPSYIRPVPQRPPANSGALCTDPADKEAYGSHDSVGATRCREDLDGIRCLPRCLLCDLWERPMGALPQGEGGDL